MSMMLTKTRLFENRGQDERPRIVIIGAGFAGIAAARALRKCDAEVLLIDRRNHHIFQPLLYQVATAVLAPSEIAAPGSLQLIRHLSAPADAGKHVQPGDVSACGQPRSTRIANNSFHRLLPDLGLHTTIGDERREAARAPRAVGV
nr:FAD-dependent oxidoreductase [Rhizobium ruizarguesonis]